MLSFQRSPGENFYIGVGNQKSVPFTTHIEKISSNKAKFGLESHNAYGKASKLLSITRDDAKAESNLEKQLNMDNSDKSLLKNYFAKKVFFRNRGMKDFNGLKSTVEKLINDYPSRLSEINQFISLIKNGAFFKAWADHYTKQAQEMSKSLGLTA